MYLFIFDDFSIKKSDRYTEEELNTAKEGCLDIIDISDPEDPKYYYRGEEEWTSIEEV